MRFYDLVHESMWGKKISRLAARAYIIFFFHMKGNDTNEADNELPRSRDCGVSIPLILATRSVFYKEAQQSCGELNPKRLKQDDVAKYLNLSRTTYTKYETGEIIPTTDSIKKLAALYKLTTDYLLNMK